MPSDLGARFFTGELGLEAFKWSIVAPLTPALPCAVYRTRELAAHTQFLYSSPLGGIAELLTAEISTSNAKHLVAERANQGLYTVNYREGHTTHSTRPLQPFPRLPVELTPTHLLHSHTHPHSPLLRLSTKEITKHEALSRTESARGPLAGGPRNGAHQAVWEEAVLNQSRPVARVAA